jgi:signal transduction histidine kinase
MWRLRSLADRVDALPRRGVAGHLLRYAVAITVSLAAWGLTVGLAPALGGPNYLPFAAAVAIATWYGGASAGLVTSALSIVAIDFSFLPPTSAVELTHSEELLDIAMFVVVAVAIGATTAELRRARVLAEIHAKSLVRANTELKQQIDRVQRLSAELERAREDTLGMVAHDLRNPLHLMTATTELLEDGDLPVRRRRELTAIAQRAARQMNRLIADLLDSAQMQAGRLSLALSELTLGALVTQAVETCSLTAKARGIRLEADVSDPELLVCADSARVQQVLGNLLSNALKFTEPGGQVVVRARPAGGKALVEVCDTGPGIAAEHISHLFEKFWQERAGDRRGIGLGLVIAKGIVEAHGGRLWVESTPGRGSTFAFTLPSEGARTERNRLAVAGA